MSADALADLDDWLKSAVAALAPAARKRLLRDIARDLRKRNQARITRQVAPDGEKWKPRKKSPRGKVRTAARMLIGLRAARRMRVKVKADGAEIGYEGRTARIAAVHQFGGMDAVAEGGPRVRYPARPVLGISVGDREWIRTEVIERLLKRL